MQHTTSNFIRLYLDPKIPFGKIYLTTKAHLKTLSQQNLARMDIIAIINCEDQEMVFKDSEITQLSPKRSIECEGTIALEVQGACKLMEETIFQQKKSVLIFGSSTENPFYFSNIYLCSFFIYCNYQFKEIDNVFEKYCRINIKARKIELSSQPNLNKIPFILNQLHLIDVLEYNGYTFYLDPYSIGEIDKFIKTKFKLKEQVQQKSDLKLTNKQAEQLQFEEILNTLSDVSNNKVFSIQNLTKSLQSIKPNEDPSIEYCKNPQPIIVEKKEIFSFIRAKK